MRGSPVLRFILLAIALAATAVGLQRVTSSQVSKLETRENSSQSTDSKTLEVPYFLTLSAPASLIEIDTGTLIRPPLDARPGSGFLTLDPGNPHVGLLVRWKNPPAPGEHRFAKLTLEPPGQETWTHVFDADGDIDDFLELPFLLKK